MASAVSRVPDTQRALVLVIPVTALSCCAGSYLHWNPVWALRMGDLARSVPVKGKNKRSELRLSVLSCVPYYSVDKALLSPFTLFIHLFLNRAKKCVSGCSSCCFLLSRREWLSYCHRTPPASDRFSLRAGEIRDHSAGGWQFHHVFFSVFSMGSKSSDREFWTHRFENFW